MQTDSTTLSPATATPIRCDATIKSGRRYGKSCQARATLYDAKGMRNRCALHRTPYTVPGTGPSWFDFDTSVGE